MDDREHRTIMYQSFFNELESIEKNAMLHKEAVGWANLAGGAQRAAGALSGAAGKAKNFLGKAQGGFGEMKDLGARGTLDDLKSTYQAGAGMASQNKGLMGQVGEGLKSVGQTDVGKAALTAGGVGLAGAGTLGAGGLALARGRGKE